GNQSSAVSHDIKVDKVAPTVSSVSITSADGIQGSKLNAGDVVHIAVKMSEITAVTGNPQLALTIGKTKVLANYATGSGTDSLVFNYTIQPGQNDTNGIAIPKDCLSLNGGTLADSAGNAATTGNALVADNKNYLVDTSLDPSVVVFDLVNGVSSAHSNRTFKADVSYTIYLRVNSTSDVLNTTPTNQAKGNWGKWGGQDKLGTDDKIILVGTGKDVLSPDSGAVDSFRAEAGSMFGWLITWSDFNAKLTGSVNVADLRGNDGGLTRQAPDGSSSVELFNSISYGFSSTTSPDDGAGVTLSQVSMTGIPTGVLESQGLI
ncbi:MAG: hypothetical protein RIR18_1061, partial [Pseudomonadota bacterium]